MNRLHVRGMCTAVLLAATLASTPFAASAQNRDREKPAAAAEAKAARPYPFNGKLEAIDKEKKTITLAGKEKGRTLNFDDKTKFVKDGKPATLADAKPGDQVAGQVVKGSDGKETVVSLRIGPKPAGEEKPKKAKAEKETKQK